MNFNSGDTFKAAENALRTTLPARSIVGMRLDGKAFHTFTRQFERPYDFAFMNAMDSTAIRVLSEVSGSLFGYVQSDEISIFFTDLWSERTQMHFSGKTEKVLSTSASLATGAFMSSVSVPLRGIPVFDARLFILKDMAELHEYVDWRRLDARKNSISMAASALHSHRFLNGKSTRERHDLLSGTEFETLPGGFFEGRLIIRDTAGWKAIPATREDTRAEVERWQF